jgi:hypothetical protein
MDQHVQIQVPEGSDVKTTRIKRCNTSATATGVFSRDMDGTIFSRRMIRDEETRQSRAAGGPKSLLHPNVPKPKGSARITERTTSAASSGVSIGGSPSSSSSSSKDNEQNSDLETSPEGGYAGSSDDRGIEVAFAFMEEFQLSGVAIRQAAGDAIDLRMKLTGATAMECCDAIIAEYRKYVDSKPEFEKGIKNWLAECNKAANLPAPKRTWVAVPESAKAAKA